jgi:hypothetical protein
MSTSAGFDYGALFDALDSQRRDLGLGWYEVADHAMRVTRWLRQPAAAFIHPAQW